MSTVEEKLSPRQGGKRRSRSVSPVAEGETPIRKSKPKTISSLVNTNSRSSGERSRSNSRSRSPSPSADRGRKKSKRQEEPEETEKGDSTPQRSRSREKKPQKKSSTKSKKTAKSHSNSRSPSPRNSQKVSPRYQDESLKEKTKAEKKKKRKSSTYSKLKKLKLGLNSDTLKLVFLHLSAMDLLSASEVSKKWNKVANLDYIWHRLFTKHHWDTFILPNQDHISYKAIYLATRTPVHIDDWESRKKKPIIKLVPLQSPNSPGAASNVKFKRKKKTYTYIAYGINW